MTAGPNSYIDGAIRQCIPAFRCSAQRGIRILRLLGDHQGGIP